MSGKGFLSTGFIFLIVASIVSVFAGVWVCAYLYKEGRRKSQIRPADEPSSKMVEPFNTKKLWERGKKKALILAESESMKTISVNGVVTKAMENLTGGEKAMTDDAHGGDINPSIAREPSPVPVVESLSPPNKHQSTSKATSAETAVEIS